MNPATLIPALEPIPVHWAWIDVLLIATFTAHILFMNATLGSAAVALVQALRGDTGLARDVGMKLPPLIALTINFGVAPLLFLQTNYGHLDYVSSVLMGGWWLSVIAALMLAYFGFYFFKFRFESLGASRNLLLFLTIAALVFVGFMFSNNMTLMLVPDLWGEYFTNHMGSFLNFGDPTLYPRFLHFMAATLALGGLFTALLGEHKGNDHHVRVGMKWFTSATLVNLGIGLWFLFALPSRVQQAFLGGSIPATASLVASLIGAGLLLSAGFQGKVRSAAVWTSLTVLFMAITRHWVRTLSIEPWFGIESMPVTGQYGPFYLFLISLVIGGGLMWYMVRLFFKAQGRA